MFVFLPSGVVYADEIYGNYINDGNTGYASVSVLDKIENVTGSLVGARVYVVASSTDDIYVLLYHCTANCDDYAGFSQDYYIQGHKVLTQTGGQYVDVDFTDKSKVANGGTYFVFIGNNMLTHNISVGGGVDLLLSQTCSISASSFQACPNVRKVYLVLNDGASNGSTRIVTVSPYGGQVVASSTPLLVGYHVYVNADYASSTVEFKVYPVNDYMQYGGLSGYKYSSTTVVGGVGDVYFSDWYNGAVSLPAAGSYEMVVTIRPQTIFGFMQPFTVSTTTWFSVGAESEFGKSYRITQQENQQFFQGMSGSSSTPISGVCDFPSYLTYYLTLGVTGTTTWNFKSCMNQLFVPSNQDLENTTSALYSKFSTKFPWGFVALFLAYQDNNDVSDLPVLSVTLPQGYPGEGTTVTMDVFNKLLGSTTMLSTAQNPNTGHTLRQIVETGWSVLVYTTFGMGLLIAIM